jgi:predicted permease
MIAQVAIAVVLLVGTGLFLRTLRNFATLDVGFDRSKLLYFEIDLGPNRVTPQAKAALSRRLQESVNQLPGVQSSALTSRPLLSGSRSSYRINLDNPKLPPGQNMSCSTNDVSPAFFQTTGIPLLLGRTFTAAEVAGDRPVAVVNDTFARTFFPGENPVGRTFGTYGSLVAKTPPRQIEIIGVVADARYADLRSSIPATIYHPLAQGAEGTFVVRTAGDPRSAISSLESTLRKLAPDASMSHVRTQQEAVDRLLTSERLFALLSGLFALVALGLTCLGLYGLLAYEVTARTREIGLRLALGAPIPAVMSLILGSGLKLVFVGLVLGLGAAFVLTRFVSALLFNVQPTDPATFAAVAVILLVVAILACWLPARRASKVDPIVALRTE